MTTPSRPTRVTDFRQLEVWRLAMTMAMDLYAVTAGFPRDERFGLTAQIRRAGVSVAANIAEGNARASRAEYRHFVSIARGSVAEIRTELMLAGRLDFLVADDCDALCERADQLSRMLASLHKSLR